MYAFAVIVVATWCMGGENEVSLLDPGLCAVVDCGVVTYLAFAEQSAVNYCSREYV